MFRVGKRSTVSAQTRKKFQTKTGEVAEWSNAAVSKAVDPQGSGGSNPSLSAS